MLCAAEKILFPLSTKYDENWIKKNSLGENVLYNLESLCGVLEFKPGMKVLDLGSGKAMSAIFLAKEFKVKVWAVDNKVSPSENYLRIKDIGLEDQILPLKLNAANLPFPKDFFDIIIAADSFMYYGTDPLYTQYISGFLKTGGQIGIVDICFKKESEYVTSQDLYPVENGGLNFAKSLDWWYNTWSSSAVLKVDVAEIVPENNFIKNEYIKDFANSKKKDFIAEELQMDTENLINIFRMTATKHKPGYIWETGHMND